MSYDEVMAAPRGRDSHDDMSSVLERIEHRIEEVESQIASIAPLVRERTRLLRARALIRGEPEPTVREPILRPRVTRGDVFEHLTRNPGSRAGEIAAALGVGQGAVSAHLQGGKGRRFACRGGRWYPVPGADTNATGR
jgi:DNA-binding transcriptional ArsR family regulator